MNNVEHASVAVRRFFELVFPSANPQQIDILQGPGSQDWVAHVSLAMMIPKDIIDNPQGAFGVFDLLRESTVIPGDEAQKLKKEIEELKKEIEELTAFKTHYNLQFYLQNAAPPNHTPMIISKEPTC